MRLGRWFLQSGRPALNGLRRAIALGYNAAEPRSRSGSGEAKMESPVSFVNQIRFGKQPKAARLVLDFTGQKVPKLKIERGKDRLIIRFY